MPQRRDNAGAVCDSGMGMLFLNGQFLSYRRLLHQKIGVEFHQGSIGTIRSSLAMSYDVAVASLHLMVPIEPWQNSTHFLVQ